MSKKAVLIITDGIGYSQKRSFNAFYSAKKPTYERLFSEVPHSLIDTSGMSVGLPKGQMGNSEVGHMTIGSGRVLYQDLVKISLAIGENSIANNEQLKNLFSKSNRLHLVGLMSDGGVHSHIDHIIGLVNLALKDGKRLFLHLITDGRDVSPTSAKKYLEILESHKHENLSIATLGGRFYYMDRDNRWERIQEAYSVMVDASEKTDLSPAEYIDLSYEIGESDEFIRPKAFSDYSGMQAGDALLSLNFRSDRVRELVTALGSREFDGFTREFLPLHIATMTEYDKRFSYPVLFKKKSPKNTLAEVVSSAGLKQFHTAETEKYAHVTFFLNGGVDEPVMNETRVLIPSPKVKTYDMKPQMSAASVGEAVLKAMDDDYDLVVVNFANGDMVGHTGDYEAAIKAVEAVDEQLGFIFDRAEKSGHAIVLTSDHGNCEEMRSDEGEMLTNHTAGSVWCFVKADGVLKVDDGGLNNIAPTVLKLLGLEVPAEMDHALI